MSDGSQINIDRRNSGELKNSNGFVNGIGIVSSYHKPSKNGKITSQSAVAQLAERLSVKEDVTGSSPVRGAIRIWIVLISQATPEVVELLVLVLKIC